MGVELIWPDIMIYLLFGSASMDSKQNWTFLQKKIAIPLALAVNGAWKT